MPHSEFIQKTTQLLDRLLAASNGAKPAVVQTTTINANATFGFDVKTLLDTPAAWDLLSTQVEVMTLDSTAGSPTQGFYINGEASVTVGINQNGMVRVHNYRDTAVSVLIRIYRPCRTATP